MESILGESSSWPLWPIHDGKPLPSDHSDFVFDDPLVIGKEGVEIAE